MLLGNPANAIATLGSFTATSFALSNAGALSVTGAVSAASLTIAGTISDGGAGTTRLTSTGAIAETGRLIAGTLTGSAALDASFTGTNTIANVGTFAANGFILNDSTSLDITGAVAGGGSIAVQSKNLLSIDGSVAAADVWLTGNSIAINGNVAANLVTLTAAGTITGFGSLTTPTLTGTAGSADLAGANQIDTLAAFTAAHDFLMRDARALTVAGPLTAGGNVAIDVGVNTLTLPAGSAIAANSVALIGGNLTIDGSINAPSSVSLTSGSSIGIRGAITDGNLTTIAAGSIVETGTLNVGKLTGSAASASFIGAGNNVANLSGFITGGTLALASNGSIGVIGNNAGSGLTIAAFSTVSAQNNVAGGNIQLTAGGIITSGSNNAPRINLNAAGTVTVASGSFVSGQTPVPKGTITDAQVPGRGTPGLHVLAANFDQTGTTTIAVPVILTIDLTGAGVARFNNLQAPNSYLFLNLNAGSGGGQVNVANLHITYQTVNPAGGVFTGLVGGQGGQPAASVATIGWPNSNYRLNACAVGSVNCFVISQVGAPIASPLTDISIGPPSKDRDELDLILPNVADRDY